MIVMLPSRLDLADERDDLRRPDVDPDQDRFSFHCSRRPSLLRALIRGSAAG